MEKALKFLKDCGVFYLATNDGDQPRVRPFGAVCGFEGKLYIITNNQKKGWLPSPKEPPQPSLARNGAAIAEEGLESAFGRIF